jgi:hypothetical protein
MSEGCHLSALDTGRRWRVSLQTLEAENEGSPLYHYDFAEAETLSETSASAVTAKASSSDSRTRLLELDDVSLVALTFKAHVCIVTAASSLLQSGTH